MYLGEAVRLMATMSRPSDLFHRNTLDENLVHIFTPFSILSYYVLHNYNVLFLFNDA